MKITQHGQYLYQLTRLTAFNSYLLKEDDGLTVIDTNLPGSANGIIKAAAELGQPIKRIVLTHAHQDHVACVDGIIAQIPDAEVIISARSARFIRGDMSLDPDEAQTPLKGGYVKFKSTITRELNDGDMVGSLRVVNSPGHTPGHISLLDTRDNSLIAGDAFAIRGGIAVAGEFKLLFPFPAMATWHKPTALASAKRLLELNPSRLAVGHGKVIENPQSVMQLAINSAEKAFN